jgi:hypothetical protein
LFWLLSFGVIKEVVFPQLSLVILLPPMLYFYPYFILSMKKNKAKELVLILTVFLSFAVLALQTMNNDNSNSKYVQKFTLDSEKWMVIGNDWPIYVSKKAASPFWNHKEIKKLCEQEVDLITIANWHHWITLYSPDVIYDPLECLKKVSNFLPILHQAYVRNNIEKKYVKKNETYNKNY